MGSYDFEWIGKRLKELREGRGVTQKEVAEAISISVKPGVSVKPDYISKWERGKSRPALDCLILLAQYYDTTVDYIVGRDLWLSEKSHLEVPNLTWKPWKILEGLDQWRALEIWSRVVKGEDYCQIMMDLQVDKEEIERKLKDLAYEEAVRIVEVKLDDRLSMDLKEKYNLLEANVPDFTTSSLFFRHEAVGYVASRYLVNYLRKYEAHDLSLGTAGGYAVSRAIANISRGELRNVSVYPLTVHPAPHKVDVSANAIVGRLVYEHSDYGVRGYSLNESAFSDREKDPIAKIILSKAAGVDVILAGVGTLDFVQGGMLQAIIGEEATQELHNRGVKADFLFHPIGRDGKLHESDINNKICSVDLNVADGLVEAKKPVIAVALGKQKVRAIDCVLKGGHANVLITDQTTAIELTRLC